MGTKILTSSSQGFEIECKEIHDSWGRVNQLVRSLATRSKLERQQIRETYKAMYGEDITSFLERMCISAGHRKEAKIGSKVFAALSLWMIHPHERDAIVAMEALEQGDTNYRALVEIFVGRKSSHIMLMKQAYLARFRRQLGQDIINLEPPNPYQKILVALSASHKAHQADVSQHIAKCDAKRLHEAGEGSSGANEEAVVLEILSKRSIPQMKLTFSSYKHIYGDEYTAKLKKENSCEFEDSLKTVITCMCNPPKYYAKALYASIRGTTTDRGALARVMMSRAEIDMDEIQDFFKKKFGMELRDAISEAIPSGDYRDFLVALATKRIAS
uniref:Ann10 n=1 Tax=Manihot esculenta TaxID=3983 RepID=A0A0E3MUH7_MANES|nr:Ann10 [Manihot esculenta]